MTDKLATSMNMKLVMTVQRTHSLAFQEAAQALEIVDDHQNLTYTSNSRPASGSWLLGKKWVCCTDLE